MITVRQIERLWSAGSYAKLLDEILAVRIEGDCRSRLSDNPSVTAAAMAMIRLDELNQSHVPLFSTLVRSVVAAQDSDGGWIEPMTTALCVRALSLGRGSGQAIERGLNYLAALQQPQGLWPKVPIRRMPADAYVSAFVLFQLSDNADFRQRVRFDDAVRWFNAAELDEECAAIWNRTRLRFRPAPANAFRPDPVLNWPRAVPA